MAWPGRAGLSNIPKELALELLCEAVSLSLKVEIKPADMDHFVLTKWQRLTLFAHSIHAAHIEESQALRAAAIPDAPTTNHEGTER